jgi:hypothetical protein
MQKYRLTHDELMLCFDATYKAEKAAEYKALYEKYRAFDPEFAMPRILGTTDYFYDCSFIQNCLHYLFTDKDITIKKIVSRTAAKYKNSIPNTPENIFFYFLSKQLSIQPVLFRFLPAKFRFNTGSNVISEAETPKFLFDATRANETPCNNSLPVFERRVYGDDLRKSIAVYLDFYKDKKIVATDEALNKHKTHCEILSKLIEYPWESLDKIEDDFQYLLSFIYALKLHIFVISEGERLRIRKDNNKLFSSIYAGGFMSESSLQEFKRRIEQMNGLEKLISHPKGEYFGLYNDNETIEEYVLRSADFFFKNPELIIETEKELKGDEEFEEFYSVDSADVVTDSENEKEEKKEETNT